MIMMSSETCVIETQRAVEAYLLHLKVRERSDATVRNYRTNLGKLVRVVEWLPCTEEDVLSALLQGKMRKNAKAQALRCMRRFFEHTDARHGTGNPTELISLEEERTDPRVLTDDELEVLVGAAQHLGEREHLLVLVILNTGIRVGEVWSITIRSFRGRWLHVEGKRGSRRVPVTLQLARRLQALADADGVLWRGRGDQRMSVEAIKKVYEKIFDEAGIEGERRGPHTLRHTFGTKYIENGGGVTTLKEIMGHDNVMTTMLYVSLAGKHILDAHERFNPAVRMGLIEGAKPPAQSGTQVHYSEPFDAELLFLRHSNDRGRD